MDQIRAKENQAIKLLQSFAQAAGEPIEISCSGGKDSDIILRLAQLADIEHRAIHKNTTIDRPGTLKHCQEQGCEILRPKKTFLELIKNKGFPTRRARFCCQELKEYKVLPYAVQGIRRRESTARAKRYTKGEFEICRFYRTKKSRTSVLLPILEWSEEDELHFIQRHELRLHPHYYDENGQPDLRRRLGCIGCPLKADNGLSDFKEYPKMARAWLQAGQDWWNKPRDTSMRCQEKYTDVYELFYSNLFCKSYEDYLRHKERTRCHDFLEDFFQIDL